MAHRTVFITLDLAKFTGIAAIFTLFVGTTEDYWSFNARSWVDLYAHDAATGLPVEEMQALIKIPTRNSRRLG